MMRMKTKYDKNIASTVLGLLVVLSVIGITIKLYVTCKAIEMMNIPGIRILFATGSIIWMLLIIVGICAVLIYAYKDE